MKNVYEISAERSEEWREGRESFRSTKRGPTLGKVELSSSKRCWHVEMVSVAPEARGMGIGRALMQMVVADADASRVTLTLEARPCHKEGNKGLEEAALIKWYESFGFSLTGRRGKFGPRMKRVPSSKGIKQAGANLLRPCSKCGAEIGERCFTWGEFPKPEVKQYLSPSKSHAARKGSK